LRIHVIEAKELKKADIGLMKKGLSDPYTVIRSRLINHQLTNHNWVRVV
jgi:hypothetical protein